MDDLFEYFVVGIFGLFILFLIFAGINHFNSKIVDNVEVTATSREYDPAWTEIQTHTRTDSKGRTCGTYTTVIQHPEEWHVEWSYRDLTYDQEVGYNYSGIKVGDHRRMNIRVGGLLGNKYLWLN